MDYSVSVIVTLTIVVVLLEMSRLFLRHLRLYVAEAVRIVALGAFAYLIIYNELVVLKATCWILTSYSIKTWTTGGGKTTFITI